MYVCKATSGIHATWPEVMVRVDAKAKEIQASQANAQLWRWWAVNHAIAMVGGNSSDHDGGWQLIRSRWWVATHPITVVGRNSFDHHGGGNSFDHDDGWKFLRSR